MRRLKGPELKKPDVRVPQALADLYQDLRDRRLLPILALVVVATAAVPFLFGDSQEPLPPPVAPEKAAEAARLEITDGSRLAVVEAKPPLRDYHKRLQGLSPTNPFKQRYTGLPKDVELESSVSSVSATTAGGGSSEGAVDVVAEETVSGEPGSAPDRDSDAVEPVQYELVIDVQIQRTKVTADGREERGELEVRRDVPVLTQLPGEKAPVVTTMGANFEKERLFFLVSHDVKAIVGEFGCVTRGEVCELLEVAPGILLEYELESSGDRLAVKVTGVDAVPVGTRRSERSTRATFATPSPGSAWKTP
jgi:hypothetical protein